MMKMSAIRCLLMFVVALKVVACDTARPQENIPDGNDASSDKDAILVADEDTLLTDPGGTTAVDAILNGDDDMLADDGDDLLANDDDAGPVAFHWTLVHPHTDHYDDTIFRGMDFPTVVVFKEALWVTGGENRTDVWNSPDGAAWEKRGSLPVQGSPLRRPAVAALGDALFHVNESGVWRSEDAAEWTNIQPEPQFGVRRGMALVVHQGELWLIGGNGGGVLFGDAWRSSDGVQWVPMGMWQTGAHSGNCTPVEGVAGPAAVSMGDRLLAVGGHYSDSCSYASGYPGIDYSYSVIHYSAQYGLYREEYGWTYPSVPESDEAPFGSHSLLVPFNGEYWSFGGQQWGSDMVRYDPGPGGSGTIIYPGQIVPNHDILTTVEGFDWQLSSYTTPFYEMAGYGAASFKEAIWLIGGNGSNAVWKGSFDPDDPVTDECVKGKYYTGDILIYTNAAAENYRGYTAAGRVVIAGSVTDIEPLHCLREVETLEIGYRDCDTCGTATLSSFTGLKDLETVSKDLFVARSMLISFDDFTSLKTVGTLTVTQSAGKSLLIRNPMTVGELMVSENEHFDTLALSGELRIGHLTVTAGRQVVIDIAPSVTLSGFKAYKLPLLTDIRGAAPVVLEELSLYGLPMLETCDLCGTLESVTDELWIDGTVLSADKTRFPVMSDIAYLRFGITLYGGDGYDNEAYNTVPTDALPLFGQTVTVPSAWIYAVRADDLSVLAGFTPTFVKMEALTASSLDGPVISEEMSGVEITNNDLLTDISSLGALKSVAGGEFVTTSQLRITGNALLADISPLMGITAVNPVVYLNITDNAALSQADAQKVADHFVNDLGLPSNHVKVSGNCAACPGLIP